MNTLILGTSLQLTTLRLRATGRRWPGPTTPASITRRSRMATWTPAPGYPAWPRMTRSASLCLMFSVSLLYCLQKLSEADKLYSSSAAAYMSELSDPRLCHTSALRLGTPTPDNKNGKRDTDKSEGGDKLIPVKEEEGVEGGMQGSSDDYGVPPGGWCDTQVTTVLHGDLHDPVPGLFMAGQATHSPDNGQDHQSRGQSPGAGGSSEAVTVCSVFSLSECEVTPPVSSVSSVPVPALPVTEVRLQQARQHRHQQPPHHSTTSKCL